MKVLIVGDRPILEDVSRLAEGNFVIAADGGANRLLSHGIRPDLVIGDMDSISSSSKRELEDVLLEDKNINSTDLEKAFDYAKNQNASQTTIIGWAGGRVDHTLAAFGLVFKGAILIDEVFHVEEIKEKFSFSSPEGTIFSLISVPTAVVSVSGSRWDLDQTTLNLGGRALHNEADSSEKVTITCHSGKLALMRGKFRLPHD